MRDVRRYIPASILTVLVEACYTQASHTYPSQ